MCAQRKANGHSPPGTGALPRLHTKIQNSLTAIAVEEIAGPFDQRLPSSIVSGALDNPRLFKLEGVPPPRPCVPTAPPEQCETRVLEWGMFHLLCQYRSRFINTSQHRANWFYQMESPTNGRLNGMEFRIKTLESVWIDLSITPVLKPVPVRRNRSMRPHSLR